MKEGIEKKMRADIELQLKQLNDEIKREQDSKFKREMS